MTLSRPSLCWLRLLACLALALGISGARFAVAAEKLVIEGSVMDRAVTDRADVLLEADMRSLENRIKAHRDATGVQIALVLVDSTLPEPIESTAAELLSGWEGGSHGLKNGVLLTLAVKDRRSRLDVGSELRKVLPSDKAQDILDDLEQGLKNGSYGATLDITVESLAKLTDPNRSLTLMEQIVEKVNQIRIIAMIVFVSALSAWWRIRYGWYSVWGCSGLRLMNFWSLGSRRRGDGGGGASSGW